MAIRFVEILKRHISPYKVSLRFISSSDKVVPKSSLFISGGRAQDTYISVTPYLDFDQRFQDCQRLEENIRRRRLDLNVTGLKDSWDFYKDWNDKKVRLLENLKESSKRIDELKTDHGEENSDELQRLNIYANLLKEEYNDVKKNVWSMEDGVIGELLSLPNELHPDTPENELEMFVYDGENNLNSSDHVSVGEKLGCLEYHDYKTCYLKDKAASFELAVPELFIEEFSKQEFIRFSNPDFTRSVLAEGVCTTTNDYSELFLLEQSENKNDQLYLCGGASLFPFCGFHAKHSVPKEFLPAKYVAAGRRYHPSLCSLPGLYSVNQSTSVELFIVSVSDEEMYKQFQCCLKMLTGLYSALGFNFKLVKKPPPYLKKWESLRVTIEVFSPFHKSFVEVGNISLLGNFISKRLRMCYADKKEEGFLHAVSGTVVNVQTLLALSLERSNAAILFVPDVIRKHMLL